MTQEQTTQNVLITFALLFIAVHIIVSLTTFCYCGEKGFSDSTSQKLWFISLVDVIVAFSLIISIVCLNQTVGNFYDNYVDSSPVDNEK